MSHPVYSQYCSLEQFSRRALCVVSGTKGNKASKCLWQARLSTPTCTYIITCMIDPFKASELFSAVVPVTSRKPCFNRAGIHLSSALSSAEAYMALGRKRNRCHYTCRQETRTARGVLWRRDTL